MIDAHHVPPELQNLLMTLVGNKWPTGNETALRAEAQDWRTAATSIRLCANQVLTAQHLVDQGLEGGTRQAFDDYLAGLVGSGSDDEYAVLPVLARCCDSAADSLEDLANEIETLRITIIGCLVVLWVQLMIDAAMLLFGGAAQAAAEIAVYREFLLLVLRQATITVVTRVAESVLAQVGFTLLAQLIELAERHRRSLNGAQLRTATVNGAVGGAVGVGAGFGGGMLRAGAGRLANTGFGRTLTASVNRLPGNGGVLAEGEATTNLAWAGGYGAVAGMAEGAAQDAVFGLSGDWVSGAANGGFNGAWGARHSAMNPGNELSISPAGHLEGGLNRYFDRPPRPSPASGPDNGSSHTPRLADDAPNPRQSSTQPDGGEDHEVRQGTPLSDDEETIWWSAPSTPHRRTDTHPNLDRHADPQPGTGSDSGSHTPLADDAPNSRRRSTQPDGGEDHEVRQETPLPDDETIWWSAPSTPHRPTDTNPSVDTNSDLPHSSHGSTVVGSHSDLQVQRRRHGVRRGEVEFPVAETADAAGDVRGDGGQVLRINQHPRSQPGH